MLEITSAKVTATPGVGGWSQVHEFTPDEPEKLAARGRLLAVVSTKRTEENGGVDAIESGRELLARFHEEYFGNLESKPFNALKDATQKVITEFKESWGDVEIAACSIVGEIVYSAAGGGGQVTICRDGALGTILNSEKDNVIAASGYPKASDTMLLATHSFYEKFPQGVIKAALTGGDPEYATSVFAPVIHGEEIQGGIGAVVIRFSEEKSESTVPSLTTNLPKEGLFLVNSFSKKASSFIQELVARLPKKQIYIKNPAEDEITSQSKKLTFSVALILIVILAVSIGFGVRQKRINDVRGKYQGILAEAIHDVDEAISLASVSPEKSRELFLESEQKLKEIESLKVKDSKIDELRKKIDESRASVLGEYVADPQLFLDLSLLSSGFTGDALSSSAGNVFILDKSGKKIVSVAISTKKSKVVAGPSVIDEANDLASYEDRAFILAGDGIYEVGSNKEKVVDKTWEGSALIRAFAGNIYVLDKNGNAIYRYAGSGTGFGEKQNWLASGTRADFSSALQWVIDGSVYVLSPNSKISKFSLGSPQAFSITGAVPEIGSIDAIYASDETEFVYFLDKAGKRVVVTDKKGKYKAQYISDAIGNASNLVVSEEEKKIILLTGDKLTSIEIKHL
jgi:hypothetical protein